MKMAIFYCVRWLHHDHSYVMDAGTVFSVFSKSFFKIIFIFILEFFWGRAGGSGSCGSVMRSQQTCQGKKNINRKKEFSPPCLIEFI